MRGFSRRSLLQTGVAAGIFGVAGMAARAHAHGGSLIAGLGGATRSDSWDSRTHAGLFMMAAAHGAVFDCLTEVAADGTLTGELAESWDASPDARVWTFDLRRDVRFHNGRPFEAADVITSMQLHLDPAHPSPALPIVASIDHMEALGPHQIQFRLKAGNADFPYLLSDYHLVIYPGKDIEAALAEGIGTGLYRTVAFEPGRRFLGARVSNHYKGDSAGYFETIEFVAINDREARSAALQAGRLDVASGISPQSFQILEAAEGIRTREVTGNQHYSFAMGTQTAPFDQLNLRLALKHGIDRQHMLDALLAGHGSVGRDSPIGPSNQYFAADLDPLPFDPDLARHYLVKADLEGLKIDLPISASGFDGALEAAQMLRSSAAQAGIDLNLLTVPQDGYWSEVALKMPFCACQWSGRATEDWMFSTAYQPNAPWNLSEWNHERFQELLIATRSELDGSVRSEQYREMQQILRDEGGMLVPLFANHIEAHRDHIIAPQTIGNLWPADNARLAERWFRA